MREFQEKQKTRKILSSRLLVALAAFTALWFLFATGQEYFAFRAAAERRTEAEEALRAMRDKITAKEESLAELGSEHGLEKIIRERFNVKKPGEELIVIVDDKSASDTRSAPKDRGFWESFTMMIKNIF